MATLCYISDWPLHVMCVRIKLIKAVASATVPVLQHKCIQCLENRMLTLKCTDMLVLRGEASAFQNILMLHFHQLANPLICQSAAQRCSVYYSMHFRRRANLCWEISPSHKKTSAGPWNAHLISHLLPGLFISSTSYKVTYDSGFWCLL